MKKEISSIETEEVKNVLPVNHSALENFSNTEGTGVLTPLQPEEAELYPHPEIEYKIVEAGTIDKVVRDVNAQLQNGWRLEGGIQVVSTSTGTKYYQSLSRRNVDSGLKSEASDPKSTYAFEQSPELDLDGNVNKDVIDG